MHARTVPNRNQTRRATIRNFTIIEKHDECVNSDKRLKTLRCAGVFRPFHNVTRRKNQNMKVWIPLFCSTSLRRVKVILNAPYML